MENLWEKFRKYIMIDGAEYEIGGFGSIFYKYTVVDVNTYYMYTKMGGTLPAFKYEIEDFFFTRLGTGRTSQSVTLRRHLNFHT